MKKSQKWFGAILLPESMVKVDPDTNETSYVVRDKSVTEVEFYRHLARWYKTHYNIHELQVRNFMFMGKFRRAWLAAFHPERIFMDNTKVSGGTPSAESDC